MLDDEHAMVSIDFLTAVGILIFAFLFAVYAISSAMTSYTGTSKELYPAADRVMTLFLEDKGYWTDGSNYGTDWNSVWAINQTYVKKIGLLDDFSNRSIMSRKSNIFMEEHNGINGAVSWWEYPAPAMDQNEYENVSSALGLQRYYFYMQIRPVNESQFNPDEADTAAINMVSGSSDVVTVSRLALMEHTDYGEFDGADLSGHQNISKVLIVIEPTEFDIIKDGIRFNISNWIFVGNNTSEFQWIRIGDQIYPDYNLKDPHQLLIGEYTLYKNNTNASSQASVLFNNDETLSFHIPASTLDNHLPGWIASGKNIYVQLNIEVKVKVTAEGQNYFSNSKITKKYPVRTTLWVW